MTLTHPMSEVHPGQRLVEVEIAQAEHPTTPIKFNTGHIKAEAEAAIARKGHWQGIKVTGVVIRDWYYCPHCGMSLLPTSQHPKGECDRYARRHH